MTTTESAATASVEVAVDPTRAFDAFTAEIDSWWVRGAVNFFDSARAVGMQIVPGVGGRVLEVYDGESLELGRIIVWEPGERLTFTSSVDDTEIDVVFEPTDIGTRVRVTQALLPDGERALLFWPKVLPWLGRWDGAGPREIARASIALCYEDPLAAAQWLEQAFGLDSWSGIPEVGEPDWIELHHGNVAILVFKGARPDGEPAHAMWIYVDDLDQHFAHTNGAGARIVSDIAQTGFRAYTAEDLEGHHWVFAQARPTML
jgi:uncharacterized glyoxalase superfamily protein PhnB